MVSDQNLCWMLQKTLKHTRFGRISVKCYYDAPEQRLTVEILHAADIIALDANGKTAPVWVKCSLFYRRFHSLSPVLVRSEWPVCHSGAVSSPPVPYGQESTHTSEAEDPAPSVRWTLLLVSTFISFSLHLRARAWGWIVWLLCLPATSALNSTDTGSPAWPSLWWTTTGCPPTTLPVKPWPLSATSAGRGDRTPRQPGRASSPPSSTCRAVNPAVRMAPGWILHFVLHKHNIGFLEVQRVQLWVSNYFSNTAWKAIQSRDICVRCRRRSHLFALPSREANHEDVGRAHRGQGGSGVCPQAEGDWEVNGGGVKKSCQRCLCWCFLTASCDMCFCTGTMFTIFEFPCNVIVCSVVTPKRKEFWKKKKKKPSEKWSLSLFSNLEMNILSLCNPILSQFNYILELNG